MKKFNYISSAKKTFKIESEAINNLSKQIDKDFVSLCDAIRLNDGKFIIMGVGKSGHIGQKISATLSSTGTGSIFIHPTEAAHGDLGLIGKKDIVFLISNSGETDEIINILPSLKRLTRKITSLTSNKKSTIAKASDIGIVLKSKEACPLDLAPTSSTTAALAFGDALAIALLESKGFTKKDAKILAEETLIGSARLIEASNIDPKKLKENVTSPGGTTEAGLLVLQSTKNGLHPLLNSTINNAIKRAKELNFDG